MRRPVVAVLLSLALAACGGGSEVTSGTRSPSSTGETKSVYVAKANAICKKVGEQSEEIPEPKDAAGFYNAMEDLHGILVQAQESLRKLEAPAADKAVIEENFLAPNDEQSQILGLALPKLEAAMKADDEARAEKEFENAFTEFGAVAEKQTPWLTEYGLTECA